jgi:hypothetical protein
MLVLQPSLNDAPSLGYPGFPAHPGHECLARLSLLFAVCSQRFFDALEEFFTVSGDSYVRAEAIDFGDRDRDDRFARSQILS